MPDKDLELGENIKIYSKDESGYALTATSKGTPPATAGEFAPGAIVVDINNKKIYINRGTTAAPVFVELSGSGDSEFVVTKETNGTTAVSVFGSAGLPVAITITDVILTSLDTTAGNITVEAPAATTVCTIAKGESAAVVVGSTTLSNTSVAAGTNVVVDSSSAGNARVKIFYRLA